MWPRSDKFKEGQKVAYIMPNGKSENGIIKMLNNKDSAWVVYKCGGDWANYFGYTGALTYYRNLVPGWHKEG